MPQFRSPVAERIYGSLTADTVLRGQAVKDRHLDALVLHISEGCNLGCSYCFADEGRYGTKHARWMKPSDAVKMLGEIYDSYRSVGYIKFFGGEPLLNVSAIRAVCEYLDDLKESGRLSALPGRGIVTNLTILDDAIIHMIDRWNIDVTVSIDGPEKQHDRFRTFHNKTGSFSIVDNNIFKLKRVHNQPRGLEAVYGPHHFEDGQSLSEVHDFLQERFGIKYIFVHPMLVSYNPSGVFSDDLLQKYNDSIYDQSVEYGKYLVRKARSNHAYDLLAHYFREITGAEKVDAHCNLGVGSLTVGADGRVWPCYMFIGKDEFLMSSSCDMDSLSDDRFIKIQMEFINNRKSDNPACQACSILKTCKACPGSMHNHDNLINSYVPVTCNFKTGMAEGLIIGLNDLGASRAELDRLMSALEAKRTMVA